MASLHFAYAGGGLAAGEAATGKSADALPVHDLVRVQAGRPDCGRPLPRTSAGFVADRRVTN